MIPMMLDITSWKIFIIGAGNVAERKIKAIINYNPVIIVISVNIKSQWINEQINLNKIKFIKKKAGINDIKKADFVITATDDPNLNDRISGYCIKKNIPVNNTSGAGNVNFCANYNKGDLTIAVSTSGICPGIGASIRNDIASYLNDDIQILFDFLKENREIIKKLNITDKENFWNNVYSIFSQKETTLDNKLEIIKNELKRLHK